MKLLLKFEDVIIGILMGFFLIAQSKVFFALPYTNITLLILSPLVGMFAILDIVHHLKHIGTHFLGYFLINVHNMLTIIFSLAIFTSIFKLSLPYVTEKASFLLSTENAFLYLGYYFIISYLLHMIGELFID